MLLVKSDIFEKIGEHIDVDNAIWEINGILTSADRKTYRYDLRLVNDKNYFISDVSENEIEIIMTFI